jgi:class 3 adenylate cyclase
MDGRDPANDVHFFAGFDAVFRFHRSSLCLYRLDRRGERLEEIGARALQVLDVLMEHQPEAVSKRALLERVWKNGTLGNVDVQIKNLRRVLEKGAPRPGSIIQNVPRRGYRFAGKLVSPTLTEPAALAVEAPHREAERRQVTALACALMIPPGAADRKSLDDRRDVVVAFRRCVAETASRHNGFIYSSVDNIALVLFGYPEAREHDPEQAVHAGLELCAAVRALERDADGATQCRVGIATGTVIIGAGNGADGFGAREIVGEAPIVAAQLQATAEPGTVAIEPVTRSLVGDLFACRDIGAIAVEGIAAPVPTSQALRAKPAASRFEALRGRGLSPLIGRDEEIDLLLRRWTRAKAGDGQLVLISGEAGIGKSRLAAALSERLSAEPHTRRRYFCSPYHRDSALFPFIDQLGRAAGFALDDAPSVTHQKLEALLTRTAPPKEDVALLADLMSLPPSERHPLPNLGPQRKKERTLQALIHQLEGLARQQPVLMVFEDAQWIDPTSREVLDLTIERIRSLPVLMILTFRPEFQPPWTGQPQVTMLALNRLDRRDRTALVQKIADGKALPDQILNQIVERTDGVPLFVEELTKSVLESGLLRGEAGHYVLDGGLPSLAIPTNLHGSLMARLDHLASARPVAQTGAVIGREFSYTLLRAVSPLPEDELQAGLARLVASELVFERGSPPDAVYFFKHALVQVTAYDSLLRLARQQMHGDIARALETHSPELTETQPELLAQHYAEAGLAEKSVIYWGKAGARSCARYTWGEALAQFQKGLDQLALFPETPDKQRQELEFWSGLGSSLWVGNGASAPETVAAFARVRELWERVGSPVEHLHIAYMLSLYYAGCGDFDLVLRLDQHLLDLSHRFKDSAGLIMGHVASGRTRMLVGRFAQSRAHVE